MTGGWYREKRDIIRSSTSNVAYQAKWFRRDGQAGKTDPWISLGDHPTDMLYGANGDEHHNTLIKNNDGANVFIRKAGNTNHYNLRYEQCNLPR